MKRLSRKTIQWIILIFIALVGVGLWSGQKAMRYLWGEAVATDATLYLPQGSNFEQLCDSLERLETLTNLRHFKQLATYTQLSERIRPGRYELSAGESYRSLINKLRSGRQTPVRITFNNIRSVDQLAGVLAARLAPDSLAFLRCFEDRALIDSLGFTPQTFIGLFIPNTYEFYWTATPEAFVERMKREYDRFWSEERKQEAAKQNLTQQEVIALASIVYEESKVAAEMPRIAGVYLNRLRIGMPLQADPTVKFAVGDFTLRRILHKHLEVNSPYNTYLHGGLPPGPICMPSITAIEAVLHPEKHDYLYFCAKGDLSGTHLFAHTLSEHNRNAQAYAATLNRLKIR